MKRHRFSPGSRGLKGFSLIELMVSLAIGLIITIAAFSAYLGASTASRIANAQARMNEDGQAALTILTQQLRMAGNNPAQPDRIDVTRRNPIYMPTYAGFIPIEQTYDGVTSSPFIPSNFAIRGCEGQFSNFTTAARIDNLNCYPDTTKPDSIAISYEADISNTVGTVPTDCLGNKLPKITATLPPSNIGLIPPPPPVKTQPYAMAENRFYIGVSRAIISPSLYCKGNGGGLNVPPQPLVENIEDMQFTYGTVKAEIPIEDVKTALVAGYLRANEVISLPSTLSIPPYDAPSWAKVITVRICVLVRSEAPAVADAGSAQYYNCATPSQLVSAPDLRLRHAYSTTVVLRNRRLHIND